MLRIEDVFEIRIPEHFGVNEYGDDFNDSIDDVLRQLDRGIDYAYGASQFVLYSFDSDIVIKLPFNGMYCWDNDENDEVFRPFQLVDNYCERALELYDQAIDDGFGEFFGKMERVGFTLDGVPIYTQEKIITENDTRVDKDEVTDSWDKASNLKDNIKISLSIHWVAKAIDFYGEDKVSDFLIYIKKNHMNEDLHTNNYGYRKSDGAPVLLDWAGFLD